MSKEIKVSVIIPNYNYSKYIAKSIYSIIESNFNKEEIEVIIIDDASTDNSINVVSEIIDKEDHNITLIKNKTNLGLAKTRNKGIKNAKGEFLFFLDSDNYIGKNCLIEHYNFLSHYKNYAACYAPIQKFDSETGDFLNLFSNQQFDFDKLKHGNYIDAMSMIKKSTFEELGGYDEEMPISGWEDFDLWLRLASNNKKVTLLDKAPLSFYRTHKGSMISNFSFADTSILSDYIDEKYGITIRKQPEENTKLLHSLKNITTQVFYASKNENFCKQNSQTSIIELDALPSTHSFTLANNKEDYENFRFDLGNEIGLINIHKIEFKSINEESLFVWNKNTISHKSDVFLIQNEELWEDKVIHMSYFKDPQFSFEVPPEVTNNLKEGIKIEITLSQTSAHQIKELNSITKTLNYLDKDKFHELELNNNSLELKLKNSNVLIDHKIKDLEHLNVLLKNNDQLISDLTTDKSFLTNELSNKNEVVKELFNQKTETESDLKKTIEEDKKRQNELLSLFKNEQKKLNKEKENLIISENKIEQVTSKMSELSTKTNLLEKEKEILALNFKNKIETNDKLKNELNEALNSLKKKSIELENSYQTIKSLNTEILEFKNKSIFKLIFEKKKKRNY